MNINEKYNLKIRYDQFGNLVPDNFYDVSEEKLILEFEKNVLELKNLNKSNYTMIELGSNQAYYSCLFKKILHATETCNIMIEPVEYAMQRGKANFQLNGLTGNFINKFIGSDTWGLDGNLFFGRLPTNSFEVDQVTLQQVMDEYKISFIDVLHCDIDQTELSMLEGNKTIFENNLIEFIYILTHQTHLKPKNYLHENCKNFLNNVGYKLTQEVYTDVDTVGGDGLLIFRK